MQSNFTDYQSLLQSINMGICYWSSTGLQSTNDGKESCHWYQHISQWDICLHLCTNRSRLHGSSWCTSSSSLYMTAKAKCFVSHWSLNSSHANLSLSNYSLLFTLIMSQLVQGHQPFLPWATFTIEIIWGATEGHWGRGGLPSAY